jgi:hypothetical protein
MSDGVLLRDVIGHVRRRSPMRLKAEVLGGGWGVQNPIKSSAPNIRIETFALLLQGSVSSWLYANFMRSD